jgi:ATP-dependent protease ClpP protease subunit
MAGRTIHFHLHGSVSPEILLPLQQEIWTAHKDKSLNIPFVLHICTEGGDIESGLALISQIHCIRREGRKFDTHVSGAAYSMGGIILQAGEHRTIDRYGFVMLHEQALYLGRGEDSKWRKKELRHEAAQLDAFEDVLVDLVARRSGLEHETVRDRYFNGHDVYLSAVVAFEHGIVDEVLDA